MAESSERLASRARSFLTLRPFAREPPRHADVLPGRSADPARPDPALDPGPPRTRPARRAAGPRHDGSGVGPRLSLGHRAAGPSRDADRGMRAPTPSQTVGPFFGFALPFEDDANAAGGES